MDVDRDHVTGWFSKRPGGDGGPFGGQLADDPVPGGRRAHLRDVYDARLDQQPDAALPLSCDTRYQRADEPVDERGRREPDSALRLDQGETVPMEEARKNWGRVGEPTSHTPTPTALHSFCRQSAAPLPQCGDGAEDAELCGEGEQVHHPGDLGQGAVIVIPEPEDPLVARRELVESGLNASRRSVRSRRASGASSTAGARPMLSSGTVATRCFRGAVHGEVSRDAVEPAGKRDAAEPGEVEIRPDSVSCVRSSASSALKPFPGGRR